MSIYIYLFMNYSPTCTYSHGVVHLHPYKARMLSVSEALAIQSAPKDFVIPDYILLTDMFHSIGNGVPYLLANSLAKMISDYFEFHFFKKIDGSVNK